MGKIGISFAFKLLHLFLICIPLGLFDLYYITFIFDLFCDYKVFFSKFWNSLS